MKQHLHCDQLVFVNSPARGGIAEKVEGLDVGADDYLAKPFSIEELAARVRALIRRSSGESIVRYRIEDLTLDLATRTVRRGSRRIDLTAREFSVLECLMRAPGRVFTRSQLCQHVWEYHFDPESNLVDVYIRRLRLKVDDGEPVTKPESRLRQALRYPVPCWKIYEGQLEAFREIEENPSSPHVITEETNELISGLIDSYLTAVPLAAILQWS